MGSPAHRPRPLYGTLVTVSPSPVVELNRAVAVGMASGPQAGLNLVEALRSEPALARYHLVSSVCGDLLYKLERFSEAHEEFARAASLTRNPRERDVLLALRAEALAKAARGTEASAKAASENAR